MTTIWESSSRRMNQRCYFLLLLISQWMVGSSTLAGLDPFIFGADNRPFTWHHQEYRDSSRMMQENQMQCFEALIFSDVDYNRQVNKTEYITFLNSYGPSDFLSSVETFDDLPLVLKSNFLILACLCLQLPDADSNCCIGDAAHISNLGAAPDETPTSDQQQSLTQVCFLTETSIDRYTGSLVPTGSPVAAPTLPPITFAPSLSPSGIVIPDPPSPVPTRSPTALPTKGPTFTPTESPSTTSATSEPTFATAPSIPTLAPTIDFTLEPNTTAFPTTSTPTATPSIMEVPSRSPSSKPSVMPTIKPTILIEVDVVAQTNYIIGVRDEMALQSSYRGDLQTSMDVLAPEVAANLTLDSGRLLLRHRFLAEVNVFLPTSVDGIISTVCPDGADADDRCEDVNVSMGLELEGESMNATGILSAFEADLRQAIANGRLQEILDRVNPESPVYIVSPIKEGEDDDVDRVITDDSNNGISGGLISGIVIGGMVGLLLTMALFSRRRQDHDSEEYFLKENQSADVQDHIAENKLESNSPPAVESESNIEVNTSDEADVEDAVATAAVVGATVAATRFSKSKKADQSMDKDSDAGSSGWSSREGLSSLEEGSNADQESKTSEAASSTRSITPSIPREETMESADPDGAGLHLTYSELDQAIQKGDWAAVGVTAALLASQSNVGSSSSPEKKVNFSGDLPPNRAAELDRLVEAGDWAGVVAAAAKFDAQESQQGSVGSVRSEPGSSTGSAYSGSGTSPTIGSGAFTSTGTSNSDSGSRVKKLDELRAEVEMLVAKVVPEEKDNIEEMLMQFRGREEELVETLRTMQEREVAQKARREGHKRAKRDARQTVEQNKLHQQHGAGVENLERPTDENWIQEIENTPSDPEIVVSTSQEVLDQMEAPQEDDEDREVLAMQNLLKQAIESEDWDKVAETAAGLSGRFVDTGDDDDQDDASTKSSDHSAEINELVEKGDWDGVVVAASKHAESEQTSSSDTPEEVARRARREQRLKEEQDALEQADIWRAIAEQTKSEHAETEAEANRAATVAADWAIARSLSELNAADKAGKLSDLEKGSDSSSGDDDQDATI